MGVNYNKNTVSSGFNSQTVLNNRETETENSFADALSRTASGSGSNVMEVDFDLNSNDLLNGNAADFASLTVNGVQITDSNSAVSTLPSQSGNKGKFLFTNGSSASWLTQPPKYFATVSDMQNDSNLVAGKDVVILGDRANSLWDVIAATGTEDGYGEIEATGSSLTAKLQTDYYINVLHFGADPTNTNDSTGAINAAADRYRELASSDRFIGNAATSNPHNDHGLVLDLGNGVYRCDGNIWFGSAGDYDDHVKNIRGRGAVINSHATGKVAVDAAGGYQYRWEGWTLFGDKTNTPLVGLLCARVGTGAPNPSSGDHKFTDFNILGNYDVSSYYDYGSEINRWVNCDIKNSKAGAQATIYHTNTNGTHQITSENVTIDTRSFQSSYGDRFVNTDPKFDVDGFAAIDVDFDGADVDTGNDQITITSHTFSDGDVVRFTEDGSGSIGGLTDDTCYFVKDVGTNLIELYTDRDLTSIVDLTSASGTNHNLYKHRNAMLIVEGGSYGPKWMSTYWDMLQGGANDTPAMLVRSGPGASATANNVQGISITNMVLEAQFDSVVRIEKGASVREIKINDINLGGTAVSGDLVVESGASVIGADLPAYRGSTAIEEFVVTNSGTITKRKYEYYPVDTIAGYDYTESTLTLDGAWRELDLPSDLSIPTNAHTVHLKVVAQNGGSISNGDLFSIRQPSNTNGGEQLDSAPSVSGVDEYIEGIVECVDGKIEYNGSSNYASGTGKARILVRGYWA